MIYLHPPKFFTYGKAAGEMAHLIREGAADPGIREKAVGLIKYVGEGVPLWELSPLFYFVQREIRYMHDPDTVDLYQTATRTIVNEVGDCDDKVILLGALASSVGFPVRMVFVFDRPVLTRTPEADFPIHVYLEADLGRRDRAPNWIPLETIPVPDANGNYRLLEMGETFKYGFPEYVEV